jgi:AraC-like DNA-binding protein
MERGITTGRLEWAHYHRLPICASIEALHARFVSHRYAKHTHEHFVIGAIESGVQAYWYRGARHVTPAGRIFLVNAGEPHTGDPVSSGGYIYQTLNLREEFLAQVAEQLSIRGVPRFPGAVLDDPDLRQLISKVHQCLAEGGPILESESIILQIATLLIEHHCDRHARAPRIGEEPLAVRRAREYLDSNFVQNISLADLATVAGLSSFYLTRLFVRSIGVPPHLYLEGVRVRKARELIDQRMELADAAIAVGYADQSHLTRRFKRFLGITPGQYRGQSKIRQDKRPPLCEI